MLGATLTLIAIFTITSANDSIFPGKCPFVAPSIDFNPSQILGEWNILQTTDAVLKENSKCAHSHINSIENGLLIEFSNHLKNGSIHDYNITLTNKETPGFYTTIAMNPELDLTIITYFVEKSFFMVWICATVSAEAHMEQMYIDGSSADIPEAVITKFFNQLANSGSKITKESLTPLPEVGCHHQK